MIRDVNGVKLFKLVDNAKYQKLFSKDMGTRGIKAGHVLLGPGENVGEHTTKDREEVIVVLNGRGEAKIGKDSIIDIEKDFVLYIPPQTNHDIKNTSQDILRYVFITALT